jgi:hypothetical protein
MKTTQKRWLRKIQHTMKPGMLALTLSIVFGIASMAPAVYAVNQSHISGWHNGMAYLAEKEIGKNEQKVVMDNKVKTAANIRAATDYDKGCINSHEEKDPEEK